MRTERGSDDCIVVDTFYDSRRGDDDGKRRGSRCARRMRVMNES
jgi:hypothetical protein